MLTIMILSVLFCGEPQLVFQQDLRFGSVEGDLNYIWPSLDTSLEVDHRGHIFVADVSESRLMEFDASGRFLRVALAHGPGPGELKGLQQIKILQNGTFLMRERLGGFKSFLVVYGRDFKPLFFVPSEHMNLGYIVPSADGSQMAARYTTVDSERIAHVQTAILKNDLAVLQHYQDSPRPLPDLSRQNDQSYWVELLTKALKLYYKGDYYFAYTSSGRLAVAHASKYEVVFADSPDKVFLSRDLKPKSNNSAHRVRWIENLTDAYRNIPVLAPILTENAVGKAVERSNPPPLKQPVWGLIPLPDDGLMVVRDVDFATMEQTGDCFNKKGAFIGSVTLKNHAFISPGVDQKTRMIFRNGYAYTIETLSDDENQVVRYKVSGL